MTLRYVSATRFDVLLPWYDPLVSLLTREQDFKTHLLEKAELQRGCRMMDVGCGSGTLLLSASQQYPHSKFTGVDADPRMLAQAARKLGTRSSVQLVVGDVTNLPAADASFDIVSCSLLFHHLTPTDKRLALGEIARVLVGGGKLLLADYCRPSCTSAAVAFLPVRILDGWLRTKCNAAGMLPHLISAAGLTNVRETLALGTPLGTLRCYEAHKHHAHTFRLPKQPACDKAAN